MKGEKKLMLTPIIETERLILRPLSIQDAEAIFERWTSDDKVSKYVRWSTHKNVNETMDWLRMEEQNIESDSMYQWGFELKESKYLFGGGGLHYNDAEDVFELGYNIMQKYWNQGYTTEAAKAIINYAIKELNAKEFIAWHAVENPASGRIIEKCGFQYEKNAIHTKFDGVTSFEAKGYRLKL